MRKSFREPFGYTSLIQKEQLKQQPTKKKERASNWKSTLLRIWHFMDEQRTYLMAVLLFIVASSFLALAGPFMIGRIIDQYIVPQSFEGMSKPLLGLVGIYLAFSVTSYFQNYWMVGIAQQAVYRLRTALFSHLQQLPVAFFDKRQHGELMSRLTNDIENVSQTLNSSFIQVVSSVLTLTGTVVVMLYLSPLLTVLTMTIVPLMFLGIRWITKRTSLLFKEQQRAVGELNGMIEETISGQRIVKAFSQEGRVLEEFAEKSEKLRHTGFWSLTYSGFIPKVMNLLNNMAFAIVAGVGGILALTTDGLVTIGTIVIFSEYARQFTRPLNDLANQFNTVLSAIAGAERVFAIMDERPEVDEASTHHQKQLVGEVVFQQVSFGYGAKEQTIHDVSFQIQPGETAAFIGATGAGKTTIMQLLARFYEVDAGMIYVDGIPIQELPRQTLRSQMAFVLQEPFLFEGTVRENIRYGKLHATDEEVEKAAQQANAHSFIQQLEKGYDTVLSADGGQISQGQKQLLSIARAIIADPVILLLDEATSNIDTVTEMAIQEALERLMEGRTSFVIAHRLNTIRKANKIFVLDQGRIIESGSPQRLMQQQGIYYEMIQSSEKE